jgi:TPR repeat protein
MSILWKQLVLAIAFALALIQAPAQTAGIDSALLARANGGDASAQVQVGESYAAGKGVAQDLQLAANWYHKAAGQGSAAGEMRLAELYRDGGTSFPRDIVQAAAWYGKAAEQGNVDAQGMLGVLYSIGQGVPQSYVEAYYWLDLAAAVKGPRQQQYAANRQMVGTHLTVDEVAGIEQRVAKWLAAHPRQSSAG